MAKASPKLEWLHGEQASRRLSRFGIESLEALGCEEPKRAVVLWLEGDWSSDETGLKEPIDLLKTIAKVPPKKILCAVAVSGSLRVPQAVLLDQDIEWAPSLLVGGDLEVRGLSLSGGQTVVLGNLAAQELVYGFYNHGQLTVRGRTRTPLVLAHDYTMSFEGGLDCPCVLSAGGHLNVPAHFSDREVERALSPSLLDARGNPKEKEIHSFLKKGKRLLRTEKELGKPAKRRLTKTAKERLAQVLKEGDQEVLDLSKGDFGFVPEELRDFRGVKSLILSDNPLGQLPDWLSEFTELEELRLAHCELTKLPEWVSNLTKLRSLDLHDNDLSAFPYGSGRFPALESLRLGTSYPEDGDTHTEMVLNIRLADFPKLRHYEADLSIGQHVGFSGDCSNWSSPTLEHVQISAKVVEGFPSGLRECPRLKSVKLSTGEEGSKAAVESLALMPQLEMVLFYIAGPSLGQIEQLVKALPRTLVAVDGLDFEKETIAPGAHVQRWYDSDFDELKSKLKALERAAEGEKNLARKLPLIEAAAAFATQALAQFPHVSPETFWFMNLGELRVCCLLDQVWWQVRRTDPNRAPGVAKALAALDSLEQEIRWFGRSRLEKWKSHLAQLRALGEKSSRSCS